MNVLTRACVASLLMIERAAIRSVVVDAVQTPKQKSAVVVVELLKAS